MPTLNPRITVTLTPEVAAVLREMSSLAGNSQSAIVAELLETSLPVFERVCAALRAAATIQDSAKSEIAAGLQRAQDKLEDQLGLMLGDMDDTMAPLLKEAEKVTRRGAARRSTPVPVTRGSGHPTAPQPATAAKRGNSAPARAFSSSRTRAKRRRG